MIYIILCGSNHKLIDGTPRQLVDICGERVVDRTIRLLRENGVDDIAITATDERFKTCGVPIINYNSVDKSNTWVNCFYLTDEPVCYIFGDVYFSPEAIKKIVETQTDSIEFFASAPPFDGRYKKSWAEPFAFKVTDTAYFKQCVEKVKELKRQGKFERDPIAWETWQVIKNTPLNYLYYGNYTVINDYTCDIDEKKDIDAFIQIAECEKEEVRYMIHATPKRMWYVEEYLIPSMFEQGIDDVDVWVDEDNEGNLMSCMKAFEECGRYKGGTWHMQDDVIISRDFAKRAARANSEILCGFHCTQYEMPKMQYSFPCIYIPNDYAAKCAEWFFKPEQQKRFSNFIQRRKCDDEVFMAFQQMMKYPYKNLNPCMVDHVDYLIGGSVANFDRGKAFQSRAKYWQDEDLVKELEVKLANRKGSLF